MPAGDQNVIEVRGVVEEVLPGAKFRVRLENDHVIIAYIAGKMRKNRIMLSVGDEVKVELPTVDLNRGRITFRF